MKFGDFVDEANQRHSKISVIISCDCRGRIFQIKIDSTFSRLHRLRKKKSNSTI